ncbi:periplasmic heavy metal sensor [Brevundimonas sp. R86498]|uniref:periplasmic heavy metal sensor n=1 Tax=Brevundimonas sp. R86498 TaxID=3093845 RepID=UPI0037C7F4B6
MNTRTLAIGLGAALAVSVAVNLFAATAAYTVLTGGDPVEWPRAGQADHRGRMTPGQVLADLDPATRRSVQQALRAASLRALPDFQQARQARRDAVAAAAAEPWDPARVTALLEASRVAEARGRKTLETETLALLGTLEPADRAAAARMLNARSGGGGGRGGKGGGRDRPDTAG